MLQAPGLEQVAEEQQGPQQNAAADAAPAEGEDAASGKSEQQQGGEQEAHPQKRHHRQTDNRLFDQGEGVPPEQGDGDQEEFGESTAGLTRHNQSKVYMTVRRLTPGGSDIFYQLVEWLSLMV